MTRISFAPIKERSFLYIVLIKQLHLYINQFTFRGLGINIKNGLFVERIVFIRIWVHQDDLGQRRLTSFRENAVKKRQQHILIVLAAKYPFEYEIHTWVKQIHRHQLHSLLL
ncbi:hypothetical protein BSK56_32930 [Paenibacillus borealis]|uniref:Uncharacterized protein n=1 Tax=Paenibacillus borealis TaxID=160799 RepID=A0ABX3GRQ2_PAEBO|nr:hypothetical protein BSK56_32930 [Paenibacillus borealis]